MALWALFEPKLGKAQGKTLQKAKGLAHLAVQDMKLFMNCHRSNYGAGRLQQLLGVTDVNWRKHWTGRWEALRSLVLAMDQAALEALHLELADYPYVLVERGL
ncbi:Phage antitermination protein Q [compost metagenome]